MIVRDEQASIQKDSKGNPVIDTELRDTETVPMTYEGGIEAFMQHEVLPFRADAFIDSDKTQIGYEINFLKYFHTTQPIESVEEIINKFKQLEQQSSILFKHLIEVRFATDELF